MDIPRSVKYDTIHKVYQNWIDRYSDLMSLKHGQELLI